MKISKNMHLERSNEIILALSLVKGIGPMKILELIEQTDGFQEGGHPDRIGTRPYKKIETHLTKELYNKFLEELELIPNRLKILDEKDVKFFTILDPIFPENLKLLSNPPTVLYYKISPNQTIEQLFSLKKIAIVGSRNTTKYGIQITKNITQSLSNDDTVIISGMAIGIDSVAHLETLKLGRPTIAVLGSSVDLPTPQSNYSTYNEILKNGMVISEYFPPTVSNPYNFPHRNRIVAGLADSVIVTQAAIDSGSMITPTVAFPLGTDIFAVPGQIGDITQVGCNELISKGIAKIYSTSDEVFKLLGLKNKSMKQNRTIKFSSTESEKIYEEISGTDSMSLEILSSKLGIVRNDLILKIMELEMEGHIKFDGVGYVRN